MVPAVRQRWPAARRRRQARRAPGRRPWCARTRPARAAPQRRAAAIPCKNFHIKHHSIIQGEMHLRGQPWHVERRGGERRLHRFSCQRRAAANRGERGLAGRTRGAGEQGGQHAREAVGAGRAPGLVRRRRGQHAQQQRDLPWARGLASFLPRGARARAIADRIWQPVRLSQIGAPRRAPSVRPARGPATARRP